MGTRHGGGGRSPGVGTRHVGGDAARGWGRGPGVGTRPGGGDEACVCRCVYEAELFVFARVLNYTLLSLDEYVSLLPVFSHLSPSFAPSLLVVFS